MASLTRAVRFNVTCHLWVYSLITIRELAGHLTAVAKRSVAFPPAVNGGTPCLNQVGAILDILEHVAFADPDAAITLLERLLRSPDINEDLEYLTMLELPLEQDFPDFPEYWEPHTELTYSVSYTDDQIDRLLALLGETISADRLRYFDQDFAFDLQRAADEYGSDTPE